jgi:hypothetical protein
MITGQVFIDVWNCRAQVSRYERYGDSITWQTAENWQHLEPAAVTAVEKQGGAINMSGHYQCPTDLAKMAVWREGVER